MLNLVWDGGVFMRQEWFAAQVYALQENLEQGGVKVILPQVGLNEHKPQDQAKMASFVDHTLLKPDATIEQIKQLISEANKYQFASVCIHPRFVSLASELLQDSNVAVCTVIGFPVGANTTATKAFEARDAIAHGADELDMVIAIGAVKDCNYATVYHDILGVKTAAQDKILKVILETSLLSETEIVQAALVAKAAGADFVKTSTGFSNGGATLEAVRLMRQTVGKDCGVKASGGIRDFATAKAMITAGANRIGTSSGILIAAGTAGDDHA